MTPLAKKSGVYCSPCVVKARQADASTGVSYMSTLQGASVLALAGQTVIVLGISSPWVYCRLVFPRDRLFWRRNREGEIWISFMFHVIVCLTSVPRISIPLLPSSDYYMSLWCSLGT